MLASVFEIAGRFRAHDNQETSVGDFTLFPAGSCTGRRVLDDPACTLYCLDSIGHRAIFVETPPMIDIHDAPFLYQAQFQHAQRVYAIALDDLLMSEASAALDLAGISFFYSVGRCGSTLLGRALHRIPDVLTLAEPDVFLQSIRTAASREPAHIWRVCAQLLCKASPQKKPSHFVMKFRHECTQLAKEIQSAIPNSTALFMYRNAVDVVISALRAFPPAVGTHHEAIESLTMSWLTNVQHYQQALRSGVKIRAVRYEDLVSAPQQVFPAVCRWLGLSIPLYAEYQPVFEADSQAGSNLSRESLRRNSVDAFGPKADIAEKVTQILARDTQIKRADLILPGTLTGLEE